MKPKMILKLAVDVGMTVALLLLMAYELIGQAAHEWIGIRCRPQVQSRNQWQTGKSRIYRFSGVYVLDLPVWR